jgi:hypothetical protein
MIRLHKVNRHFERRSIHRPIVEWNWLDNGLWYISFSWGDGNADPVWLIEFLFTTAKYDEGAP